MGVLKKAGATQRQQIPISKLLAYAEKRIIADCVELLLNVRDSARGEMSRMHWLQNSLTNLSKTMHLCALGHQGLNYP